MSAHTPELARAAMQQYARAMRTGNHTLAINIERHWGLFGFPPEIVSTVLSCVATGLPLEAAVNEVTGRST